MILLGKFVPRSREGLLITLHVQVLILPATHSVWHECSCQLCLCRQLPFVDLARACVRVAESARGSMPSQGTVTNELRIGATAACGPLHFKCWHHLGTKYSADQLHNMQPSLHLRMHHVHLGRDATR